VENEMQKKNDDYMVRNSAFHKIKQDHTKKMEGAGQVW
jgi:uncharacterized protein YeeX (DUF496 family)